MDLLKLEQLIAFSEHETLSAAAEALHISQPTLTRTMQSLEDEIGVKLFEHRKNKLLFNETGRLAVDWARKLLTDKEEMLLRIREFDRSLHTVSIGTVAMAPLWDITPKLTEAFPEMTISTRLAEEDRLLQGLGDSLYNMIILTHDMEDPAFRSLMWGQEFLYAALPLAHPLADQKGIYFREIDGESMILYSNIGYWYQIHTQKMPHSKIMLQPDREDFEEIVNNSSLISFMSNYSRRQYEPPKNRVLVPILDEEAKLDFYCIVKKERKDLLEIV